MKGIIIILGFLFIVPYTADAQFFKKKKDPENDSLRNGKYYEYWDRDSLHLSARGHFCNGVPCKKWKYFHYEGKRRMKVKYSDDLKIKYYNAKGRLTQKGHATLEWNGQSTHFYWHGLWKYYDHKRKLYRIARFEKGKEVEIIFGPDEPIYAW